MAGLIKYKLFQLLIRNTKIPKSTMIWQLLIPFPTNIKRKLTHVLLYNLLRRLYHYGIVCHDT
jgi:hypothetical protein